MQLYGGEPDILAEAARWGRAARRHLDRPQHGLPGGQSHQNPCKAACCCASRPARLACCKAVVDAVRIPVTCKIRLGWDDDSIIVDSLPSALCDQGAVAISVHGRTNRPAFFATCASGRHRPHGGSRQAHPSACRGDRQRRHHRATGRRNHDARHRLRRRDDCPRPVRPTLAAPAPSATAWPPAATPNRYHAGNAPNWYWIISSC